MASLHGTRALTEVNTPAKHLVSILLVVNNDVARYTYSLKV